MDRYRRNQNNHTLGKNHSHQKRKPNIKENTNIFGLYQEKKNDMKRRKERKKYVIYT